MRARVPSLMIPLVLASCPGDPARDTDAVPSTTGGSASGDATSSGPAVTSTGEATTPTSGATTGGTTTLPNDTTTGTSTGEPACPAGVICVDTFPFTDTRDTQAGASVLDGYACAPDTDESGPEIVYRVSVPAAGFLSAAVYDGEACVPFGDRLWAVPVGSLWEEV